jgi:hypothetical protein
MYNALHLCGCCHIKAVVRLLDTVGSEVVTDL